jgi:FeS assembly SUF system protein
MALDKSALEEKVIDMIRTIYDPEIPVDIFELGLIYEVAVDDDANVDITMTLTSPSCPVAESMPAEVEEKCGSVEGVKKAKVELTFEPPWDKDMMSEAAMLELGFM